jgi:hypothetical protein
MGWWLSGVWWGLACTPTATVETPVDNPPIVEPSVDGRPSIVLVSWDTVSATHLALYGGRAQTPNLADLARTGTLYSQVSTHYPQTGISHWTMLTGAEPALHGHVARNHDSTWIGPTLAQELRDQGYTTGAFVGGITMEAQLTGLDRGFDHYDDRGDPSQEPKRSARDVVGAARSWISQQNSPFFALVHLFDAHYPYEPPDPIARQADPEYTGTVDGSVASLADYQGAHPPGPVLDARDLEHVERLYEAEITLLDEQLGNLLEGLPDGTRVLVTSDHGESFGHGYYFNHRESLTDEVLRVPLVTGTVGGTTEGRVVDEAMGLSALYDLILEQERETTDTVAAMTDPFEGSGRTTLRRGNTKVTWDGETVQAFVDDEPVDEMPPWAESERAEYDQRIEDGKARTRILEPATPPTHQQLRQLEALGYVTPGSPPQQRPTGAPGQQGQRPLRPPSNPPPGQ